MYGNKRTRGKLIGSNNRVLSMVLPGKRVFKIWGVNNTLVIQICSSETTPMTNKRTRAYYIIIYFCRQQLNVRCPGDTIHRKRCGYKSFKEHQSW